MPPRTYRDDGNGNIDEIFDRLDVVPSILREVRERFNLPDLLGPALELDPFGDDALEELRDEGSSSAGCNGVVSESSISVPLANSAASSPRRGSASSAS